MNDRPIRFRPHDRSRTVAAFLLLLLGASPALAGLRVTGSNGIAITGADGVVYTGTSGIVASGADGVLALTPNGIVAPVTSGIAITGADAATSVGTDGLVATGVDGTSVARAEGLTATGPDGIAITGADGTVYEAESVFVTSPSGIAITGADGIAITGADGIAITGADGATVTAADGIVARFPQGIAITGADGIAITGADGSVFAVEPSGIAITGADGIAITGADGIAITGADGIAITGADGEPSGDATGLQSLDPELALVLDHVTDDTNVNAAIVYHARPTDSDVAELVSLGVLGGTRYRALPVILVTATKQQLVAVSHLPAVRALYGVRTFTLSADMSREATGAARAAADTDLHGASGGSGFAGRGVTVAVLDTGVNAGHPDLAGRVARNVRLLDRPGAPTGFAYPIDAEGLPNTDTLSGHGTFVAGLVAGTGAASGGRIRGIAPEASIVGLSAGALDLPHVLAGFDYLLERGAELGVRVVNCSFSANTVFDLNDPVNVATKLLVERGISVVFSAGNAGPGWNTLNPYAAAPWVVSVGATDREGRLASFSSRGAFGSATFRPTLVAPGVGVVSLRSDPALSVTGALGIESGEDLANLAPAELPYYTTSSGTSFSAPLVAGTIALLLEANPALGPAEVKDLLSRSASPMAPLLAHEAGAGRLDAYAALLEAAFADRRMGAFRATLDRGQVRFSADPVVTVDTTASPRQGASFDVLVPQGALRLSVEIAWGPTLTLNDLALTLVDPDGVVRATSSTLNLPGLTGRRERIALDAPRPGRWRARVTNTLGIVGTMQRVTGTVEVARAEVGPFTDLGDLTDEERADTIASVRSFAVLATSRHFRPARAATKTDLAGALVRTGIVPQYLAGSASYTDIRDRETRLYVESALRAPGGPLFPAATVGGHFGRNDAVDRLDAAVALVRAEGLTTEAEARAGDPLPGVADAGAIEPSLRGYVAVALERGLLEARDGQFEPAAPLSRLALARAIARMLLRRAPASA